MDKVRLSIPGLIQQGVSDFKASGEYKLDLFNASKKYFDRGQKHIFHCIIDTREGVTPDFEQIKDWFVRMTYTENVLVAHAVLPYEADELARIQKKFPDWIPPPLAETNFYTGCHLEGLPEEAVGFEQQLVIDGVNSVPVVVVDEMLDVSIGVSVQAQASPHDSDVFCMHCSRVDEKNRHLRMRFPPRPGGPRN